MVVVVERARVGPGWNGVTLPNLSALALPPIVVLNPAIIPSHTVMAGPPPPGVAPLPLPLRLHSLSLFQQVAVEQQGSGGRVKQDGLKRA